MKLELLSGLLFWMLVEVGLFLEEVDEVFWDFVEEGVFVFLGFFFLLFLDVVLVGFECFFDVVVDIDILFLFC